MKHPDGVQNTTMTYMSKKFRNSEHYNCTNIHVKEWDWLSRLKVNANCARKKKTEQRERTRAHSMTIRQKISTGNNTVQNRDE